MAEKRIDSQTRRAATAQRRVAESRPPQAAPLAGRLAAAVTSAPLRPAPAATLSYSPSQPGLGAPGSRLSLGFPTDRLGIPIKLPSKMLKTL